MSCTTDKSLKKYYEGACMLCENRCGVDRKTSRGACGADDRIFIASSTLHFGEEPPISGKRGSGTIFFSWCSMKCIYCQNFPISRMGQGNESSINDLSERMLKLQKEGAHNINFVTPTHYMYHAAEASIASRKRGLTVPIVMNTSSYENPETVDCIGEISDIFLADIRYSNDVDALKYSKVENYTKTVFSNVEKFYRMKGNLLLDDEGIAVKGLLIRILALPGMNRQTKEIISFVKERISKDAYVSLMSQFHPYNCASNEEINRKISVLEYEDLVDYADSSGMENIFIQDIS